MDLLRLCDTNDSAGQASASISSCLGKLVTTLTQVIRISVDLKIE